MKNYLNKKNQKLFFKIHKNLLLFTNQYTQLSKKFQTLDDWGKYEGFLEDACNLRNHLFNNKTILEKFLNLNPANLNKEELLLAQYWENAIIKDFIIIKYLKNYSVFLDSETDKLYGVLGLMGSIEDVVPKYHLPIFIHTVLIPFFDNIVYDGILQASNIAFGNNYIKSFKTDYNRIKQEFGIITNLKP